MPQLAITLSQLVLKLVICMIPLVLNLSVKQKGLIYGPLQNTNLKSWGFLFSLSCGDWHMVVVHDGEGEPVTEEGAELGDNAGQKP